MKKFGFTLAELLITLGIISVVSALTLPTLMNDTTNAQIGPKLAKAVSMFEQANEALLSSKGTDTLTDAALTANDGTYWNALDDHLKGTVRTESASTNGTTTYNFLSKDGVKYKYTPTAYTYSNAPAYQQKIGDITIDINDNTSPNTNGTDIFDFSFWNDGSLRPKGGTNWDGSGNSTTWKTKCKKNSTPEDATFCAGHIFENNLKVLYK